MFKQSNLFSSDLNRRFLPWMTVFTVFFATLLLASVLSINHALKSWHVVVEESMTLQLIPHYDTDADPQQELDRRTTKVVSLLATTAKIKNVHPIPEETIRKLLEPWIGTERKLDKTLFPTMIEVKTIKGFSDEDYYDLMNKIKKVDNSFRMERHEDWLDKITQIAKTFRSLAFLVLLFVLGANAGMIIYATRTSLSVHRETLELLHQMGAYDSYVARIVTAKNTLLSLVGGFIGILIALPVFNLFTKMARETQSGLLSLLYLDTPDKVVLFCLPLIASVICAFTSWWTVHRTLKRTI
ncbi:MAG: hypothetical protein JXR30_00865 [Alphaproteobacteria bacterium]|nr:hypothetical protein [Alphaproteobacteria bacterium]